MDREIIPLVERINATPYMGYYTIAGGGSRFASDFLECGGGSATILGINIPYNQAMFKEAIGRRYNDPFRGKYVSETAALRLATNAYYNARKVVDEDKAFGVGVTVSLAKTVPTTKIVAEIRESYGYNSKGLPSKSKIAIDRELTEVERKSREHKIFIVGVTDGKTVYKTIVLQQGRDRTFEEMIVVRNIFKVTAELVGVEFDVPDYFGMEIMRNDEFTKDFVRENIDYKVIIKSPDERLIVWPDEEGVVIFPGAFNPIHKGHRAIKEFVEKTFNKTVVYELSKRNVDKSTTDREEIQKRIEKINDLTFVTNAATFKEKIRLFGGKNLTFVIGADTYERIVNLEYNTLADIESWIENNIHFIVMPRDGDTLESIATMHSDDDKEVLKTFKNLITLVTQDALKNFEQIGISSTQIRNGEIEG